MIIAGIDEAGYGPLLGPLVVSATAFEVTDGEFREDVGEIPCLWKTLKYAVAKKHPAKKGRLLIADSKIVNGLTDGTKMLERGVLAFLRCMHGAGSLTAEQLLQTLGCTNHELTAHPWYAPAALPLPWLAEPGDLAISTNMLAGALRGAGVKPVWMQTALVSERAYNRLVLGTNNKASALVSITLRHLYHLHTQFGHKGLIVGIDKQGGRDHYTGLLLQSFPEAELKVIAESAESSCYLLREKVMIDGVPTQRRTLIQFREKGETAFLPTALASMTCKYLR